MNNKPNNPPAGVSGKLKFGYIITGLAIIFLIVSLVYSSWVKYNEHEANLPRCGIETIALALRTFHSQTGRFPKDFRELDERIWKGSKRKQISEDGKSLYAPLSNYYYVLHVIGSKDGVNIKQSPKAGIWAVPTGARAEEAATHFWYLSPTNTEKWMGPALLLQNIGVVKTIPTEQQLALLVMTRQATNKTNERSTGRGIFPILGF